MSGDRGAHGRPAGPLELDLGLIDEDLNQPRTADNPGFTVASLNELAASIRLRGVKTPISVRENPDQPGRYIINHGARRYRSARIAGHQSIPGFVDNDYNEADQVIENLQRNALTPREVANFIGRELAKGCKKGEIAHAISKSPAFVTQHANLLDLPDPIAEAFNSGRARDVTVVNELLIAHKKHERQVREWLRNESQEITRGTVKQLRKFLVDSAPKSGDDASFPPNDAGGAAVKTLKGEGARLAKSTQAGRSWPSSLKVPIVQVRHANRDARLVLQRPGKRPGHGWLRYDDSGEECEIRLSELVLVALLNS